MGPCRIVEESTQHSLGPWTKWQNVRAPISVVKSLFLAVDWTDTGLPSSTEGAIRAGDTAADAPQIPVPTGWFLA